MGAARLRISSFPVIGTGKDAHEWTEPKPPPVSASHCFQNDTVEAMIDGLEPKNSNDHSIPRFTWWDHRGTGEWVQYDFTKPRKVSAVEVYWFDDSPNGGCRAPRFWKLFYHQGESWKPVESANGFGTAPMTTAAPTPPVALAQRIAAVRRFNRFYTQRIGLLQDGWAKSPFSLAEARHIVRHLFEPNPWIYWIDFLASMVVGAVCFGLVRRVPLGSMSM